jgi:hypothetical protein
VYGEYLSGGSEQVLVIDTIDYDGAAQAVLAAGFGVFSW